jgi:hypothetical protein
MGQKYYFLIKKIQIIGRKNRFSYMTYLLICIVFDFGYSTASTIKTTSRKTQNPKIVQPKKKNNLEKLKTQLNRRIQEAIFKKLLFIK